MNAGLHVLEKFYLTEFEQSRSGFVAFPHAQREVFQRQAWRLPRTTSAISVRSYGRFCLRHDNRTSSSRSMTEVESAAVMYLINVRSLELEEFGDETQVQYAVLSHRWQAGELIFEDTVRKQGHRYLPVDQIPEKVQRCCRQAANDGLSYVWIDTCCINKTDASQHEEAINSMFSYYQNAEVCYSYHFDVPGVFLTKSELFKRGWTLQELLAPRKLVLFDRDWNKLGERLGLADQISNTTGIPSHVLRDAFVPNADTRLLAAETISWAQGRSTGRAADKAYSLLGLLDINMPMLYGLRERAFLKLQEAILLEHDDYSVFAWNGVRPGNPSLLADSPDCFQTGVFGQALINTNRVRRDRNVTSDGVTLDINLAPWQSRVYVAYLDIELAEEEEDRALGIFVKQIDYNDRFARIPAEMAGLSDCMDLMGFDPDRRDSVRTRKITVVNRLKDFELEAYRCEDISAFTIHQAIRGPALQGKLDYYQDKYNKERTTLGELPITLTHRHSGDGLTAKVRFTPPLGPGSSSSTRIYALALGFDHDFRPVCTLALSAIAADTLDDIKVRTYLDRSHEFEHSKSGFVNPSLQIDFPDFEPRVNWKAILNDELYIVGPPSSEYEFGIIVTLTDVTAAARKPRGGRVTITVDRRKIGEPWNVCVDLDPPREEFTRRTYGQPQEELLKSEKKEKQSGASKWGFPSKSKS